MLGSIALVGIAIAFALFAGTDGILRDARRVDVPVSSASRVLQFDQWRDGHSVLYETDLQRTTAVVGTYSVSSMTTQRVGTFPLPVHVDPKYGRYTDRVVHTDDAGRISPDGNWSIWCTGDRYEIVSLRTGATTFVPMKVPRDEQAIDYWPYYCRSWTAWMPDSRRWVEMCPDRRGQPWLIVHALSGAVISRTKFGVALANSYLYEPYPGRPALLGVTPAELVIAWDLGRTLYEIDLARSPAAVTQHNVEVPNEGALLDAVLSPDGNRILWRTHVEPPRWVQELRFRTRIPCAIGTHTLWISNSDGGQVRQLARESLSEAVEMSSDNPDYTFSTFRWLPGGKSISFVYDGKLWVYPVQ